MNVLGSLRRLGVGRPLHLPLPPGPLPWVSEKLDVPSTAPTFRALEVTLLQDCPHQCAATLRFEYRGYVAEPVTVSYETMRDSKQFMTVAWRYIRAAVYDQHPGIAPNPEMAGC